MRPVRPRVSLRLKVLVFVSLTMIGLAVTLGTVFQRTWVATQRAEFEKRARARTQAAALASEYGVLANNAESLDGVIEGLQNESDILYAYVRDDAGDVLAQAGAIPRTLSAARLEEVRRQALRATDITVSPLNPSNAGLSDMEVAVPIFWDTAVGEASAEDVLLGTETATRRERIGVVQVGFSAADLARQQRVIRDRILRLTVLVTLVVLVVAAFLSNFIVKPIQRLAEATRNVAAGDLSIRVPVSGNDELTELARSFNQMTDELQESREELDSYHRTLEFQVAERTDALRMANEELRRINDELARANRLKSEFLANMSHELRTPLNAIIGFSELLSDEVFGPLNDKQQRYVDNVMTSGRHLLNLINEILDLAKVESGKMELQPEPFNPEAAISDITNIVRTLAQKKGIALRVSAPQPIGVILADPKRFKQVLYNLLSNAIKFTPDGGTVSVRATLEPAGPTPLWLQVSVSDTGIGIDPADQERIFNEFEQVDGTHSREYGGTGLGLALTRKLVEMHGGAIRVESEVGTGSTFIFSIPLHRPTERATAAELRVPAAAGNGNAPLLYIGSASESTQANLDEYLHGHGYDVHWLSPRDNVVERAHAIGPRVILLDLTPDPAMAYGLWHTLHNDPELMHVPTILFVSPDVEAEGFALCAAAHFTKPVERDALLRTLHTLIPSTNSQPGRILLVDDDPQYLEMTADMLRREGFEVLVADSGAAGIEAVERQAPDIVLLDLMMPEVNGFEVVAHLRAHPETADIPIVIVTAKDLTNEDVRILNGHVASIAQKGLFSREDLLREINHAYAQTLVRE